MLTGTVRAFRQPMKRSGYWSLYIMRATRSWPHSQLSSSVRSWVTPNPLSAKKFAIRRVLTAISPNVVRRSPHTVISRSGTTSAMASTTAPIVHSVIGYFLVERLQTQVFTVYLSVVHSTTDLVGSMAAFRPACVVSESASAGAIRFANHMACPSASAAESRQALSLPFRGSLLEKRSEPFDEVWRSQQPGVHGVGQRPQFGLIAGDRRVENPQRAAHCKRCVGADLPRKPERPV